MKYVFLGLILLFVAMYAVALSTLETHGDPQRTTIYWSTDPNPARVKQIATFEEMHPDIEVLLEKQDATKIIVRCATGTGPDVIDVYDAFQLLTRVEAGILTDLTPFAEEMGFGLGNTYPSLREALTVEGRQYRYPDNVWAMAVIYNEKILEDHGAPIPSQDWTWEEFIEITLAVRNNPSKSGEKHIPVANWSSDILFRDMLVGHGGTLFSTDGLTSALDAPEAIATMELFRDLALVHDIMPTSAEAVNLSSQGGWGAGGIAWFFNRQAAIIFIGRWGIVRIPAYLKRNPGIDEDIASVVFPRLPGRPSQVAVRTRAAGINAKSEHREESMKFLQYLASREYGQLIVKDGDSLPPNPELARSGADLVNDIIPDPDFHQIFIDAVRTGRPHALSPFIEAGPSQRWIKEAVEGVENGAEPAQRLRQLAGEMNERIRQNLKRRPELQEKFTTLTGRPYTHDWWKDYPRAEDRQRWAAKEEQNRSEVVR
ncbi:MAG: extracellular solute-binding protein [Gemmatimonadetes bacterium]|nr:extracellular solute-binding protein [Gemmatimonadota bacterium]